MERTLSMNNPVLRQNKGVLLNTFVKKLLSLDSFLYILSIYPFLLAVLMYNVVSFDRCVFRTYYRVVYTKCPLHLSCILLDLYPSLVLYPILITMTLPIYHSE